MATHHTVLFKGPGSKTGSQESPPSMLRSSRPSFPGGPLPFVRKTIDGSSDRVTTDRVYCHGESRDENRQCSPSSSLTCSPRLVVARILREPVFVRVTAMP